MEDNILENELLYELPYEEITKIKEQYRKGFTDVWVDEIIEKVKEIQADIDRLEQLCEERIEKIKLEKELKVEKLKKQQEYYLYVLGYIVKGSPDKKETKTQYKKQFLSGDVIIKKPRVELKKPEISEDVIKERFADYKKEKIELDWKELKKDLVYIDGKVIHTVTGEDMSDVIPVEMIPEKIEVK